MLFSEDDITKYIDTKADKKDFDIWTKAVEASINKQMFYISVFVVVVVLSAIFSIAVSIWIDYKNTKGSNNDIAQGIINSNGELSKKIDDLEGKIILLNGVKK